MDELGLPPEAYSVQTKFARKLTNNERVAIIAMFRSGVKRDVLAEAFGVDRRTIGHMVTPESTHYRQDRKRFEMLGLERVRTEIITPEMKIRVADAAIKLRTIRTEERTEKIAANKADDRYAGIKTIQPPQCAYSHRIEIMYLDHDVAEPGWYIRDLDSRDPEAWFHNGPDSLRTSKAAYEAALENTVDEL